MRPAPLPEGGGLKKVLLLNGPPGGVEGGGSPTDKLPIIRLIHVHARVRAFLPLP